MQIFGHRGAAGLAPENTIASFKKAVESGTNWIEFDVCLTRDGVPVIFHDEDISRCSNGAGLIAELEYVELQKLDFGSWFSTEFTGERILSLNELLHFIQQQNLGFNLEFKLHPGVNYKQLVDKTILSLQQAGLSTQRAVFSSFDPEVLNYFHQCCPSEKTAILLDQPMDDWQAWFLESGATAIHFDFDLINTAFASEFLDQGHILKCFTINDPTQLNALYEKGVSGVFTDYPDRFNEALLSTQ